MSAVQRVRWDRVAVLMVAIAFWVVVGLVLWWML